MNEPSNELYNNVIFSRHFGNVRNMTPTNMPCDFDGFQKLIDLLFPDDIYNPKLSEIISSVKNSMNDNELSTVCPESEKMEKTPKPQNPKTPKPHCKKVVLKKLYLKLEFYIFDANVLSSRVNAFA